MIGVGIDTETAGTDEDARILSIGAYWKQGDEEHFFDQWVRPAKIEPGCTGPLAAVAVHGITPDAIGVRGRASGQVAFALGEFVPREPFYYVAHNAPFDHDKLNWFHHSICEDEPSESVTEGYWKEFDRACSQPWVDTLRLAQKVLTEEEQVTLGNLKLDTLWLWHMQLHGGSLDDAVKWIKDNRSNHDATIDARMALELFQKTLGKRVPSAVRKIPELIAWLQQPMLIPAWTFGKHKGEAFDDTRPYCKWFVGQPWAHERPDDYYSAKVALGMERPE